VVRTSFLRCCSDAVALAGPVAIKLHASPTELLRHCRGQPRSAHAVLEMLLVEWRFRNSVRSGGIRLASPFATLDWRLLIECNIILSELKSFTVDILGDLDCSDATVAQLRSLGVPTLTL
jgi:hypothetical protein